MKSFPTTSRFIGLLCAMTVSSTVVAAQELALNQISPASYSVDTGSLDDDVISQSLARLERRLQIYDRDYEAWLLKGLILFKSGRTDDALQELEQLTQKAPKFHLAHLVKADILQSRYHVVDTLGATPALAQVTKKQQIQIKRLRDEASARLRSYLATMDHNLIPAQMMLLGDSVKTAVLVDKDNHRLYIYENPGNGAAPRLLRDFYASTGKLIGDKRVRDDLKTPEGVYFVESYMSDASLPDKYGVGAFPLNYPNELDTHLGQTGYGIWLHGTDKGYFSRPPLDTEGCVALTNIDLDEVKPYIKPGLTPVVIAQKIEWLDTMQWQQRKRQLLGKLEQWRQDWESLDADRYLSHYSDDFWSKRFNKQALISYKRAVFQGKSYQKIRLQDISLFTYPTSKLEDRPMVVVNFTQDYESNNFRRHGARKRVYLQHAGSEGWKLVYEGGQ
ncbi:MAG: L,D-transpeptidase family protein [Gammaproteobacteria bacterium]|nr:L,D-transpeptidase family protein [Gammaproteobacteria bacterium]